MAISLHTLQTPIRRRSKRIGRGNSSGRGAYSGRGIKGQNARSGGGHGIKARSLKSLFQRIPKSRGFRSESEGSVRALNLRDVERLFPKKGMVQLSDYRRAGLLTGKQRRIKILGIGMLHRAMTIHAHSVSVSARSAIEKSGGSVHIIPRVEAKKPTKKARV